MDELIKNKLLVEQVADVVCTQLGVDINSVFGLDRQAYIGGKGSPCLYSSQGFRTNNPISRTRVREVDKLGVKEVRNEETTHRYVR